MKSQNSKKVLCFSRESSVVVFSVEFSHAFDFSFNFFHTHTDTHTLLSKKEMEGSGESGECDPYDMQCAPSSTMGMGTRSWDMKKSFNLALRPLLTACSNEVN